MDPIILRHETLGGEALEATFLPGQGMNLCSYKLGEIEVIDQQTRPLFEERCAGLGALIGPHFHHRSAEMIPPLKDEDLFPHLAALRAKGVKEPFSHGIARYVPWKVEATEKKVTAFLEGSDTYKGVTLSSLEGQQFKMQYVAELTSNGLQIDYSIVSDNPSVIGLHYYYALDNSASTVLSTVCDQYRSSAGFKEIPREWIAPPHQLTFDLAMDADYGFIPYPNSLQGVVVLKTGSYQLTKSYNCLNEESSWQLYHPKGASFACIEPLSAKDPTHPKLNMSTLHVLIRIDKIGRS